MNLMIDSALSTVRFRPLRGEEGLCARLQRRQARVEFNGVTEGDVATT